MRWDAKTSQAQREAAARYDADNTVRVSLKLNRRTDADIIAYLQGQPNKQGLIKTLLRAEMEKGRGS